MVDEETLANVPHVDQVRTDGDEVGISRGYQDNEIVSTLRAQRKLTASARAQKGVPQYMTRTAVLLQNLETIWMVECLYALCLPRHELSCCPIDPPTQVVLYVVDLFRWTA